MKKYFIMLLVSAVCCCTTLTHQERDQLYQLKSQGITVDRAGDFEPPANPGVAGVLNILPGFGNFYLAAGNGAESSHWLYGFLNLLFWPISVVWAIPEAAIDANTINERELIYHYKYDRPQYQRQSPVYYYN